MDSKPARHMDEAISPSHYQFRATVTLDDGTAIVSGGTVVPGAGISVATNDFSARGGDQWFSNFGATFTSIGVSYQQALSNYVQAADGLSGVISAADYPAGGEGRITRIN